ncbi:MAG: 3-isopropylmalate dehydrogenase, partial [Gemmatimonadetes bacterium]|nr:3-isopropylmalate dehydrogenase [Gemmatimonadota bacterium]
MKLAAIGGDGIGPEVVAVAADVLSAAAARHGIDLTLDRWDLGADRYLRDGVAITDEERDRLIRDYDAALLGALGDARVPDLAHIRDFVLG